ncbi:hypothetical protein B0T16DRAFT_451084 [Cercophora newfieldiana]|uniref:Uncharacterized protein n=1 Tax=Cercophora newfieldiana TaxID=92897 RepID=A0AA39YPK3_9PEZI|nr:hypothetical protein B0T16DRAFT_451084 [Cercophora newfieldiana]
MAVAGNETTNPNRREERILLSAEELFQLMPSFQQWIETIHFEDKKITEYMRASRQNAEVANETYQVLEKIWALNNNWVLNYLGKQVWQPKKYQENGIWKSSMDLIKTKEMAMAVCLWIFDEEKKKTHGDCPTCRHDNHQGPNKGCFVPRDATVGQGACTNCYAKGIATMCFDRKEKKKEEEKEEFEKWRTRRVPTVKKLKAFTVPQLQMYIEMLEKEKRMRLREQDVTPERPAKRVKRR